jgi:hypothetical protein
MPMRVSHLNWYRRTLVYRSRAVRELSSTNVFHSAQALATQAFMMCFVAYTSPDRRSRGRSTADRRDHRTRLEGVWTEIERGNRVAAIREELHDSRAITIRRLQPTADQGSHPVSSE